MNRAELEWLRGRAARVRESEEIARGELERTLDRIGSDRPPERDSDDYEPAPVSVALHG